MATTTATPRITLSDGTLVPVGHESQKLMYEQAIKAKANPTDPTNAQWLKDMATAGIVLPPSEQPAGTTTDTINQNTQAQKDQLQKELDQGEARDQETLDANLAARGISRGGAYGAGQTSIATNYANALAKGNLGIDTQSIQTQLHAQQQNMMGKYYDALTQNLQNKNSSANGGGATFMGEYGQQNLQDPGNANWWATGGNSNQYNMNNLTDQLNGFTKDGGTVNKTTKAPTYQIYKG